jgi:hypothetical protein
MAILYSCFLVTPYFFEKTMSESQGHGGDPHALVLHVFKDLSCYVFFKSML